MAVTNLQAIDATPEQLKLDRCPHCGVAAPVLGRCWCGESTAHNGSNPRYWFVCCCTTCGGMVLAFVYPRATRIVVATWPAESLAAEEIPTKARSYLQQAMRSIHAPAGAVMLAASAVDAMLKDKGFREGSLKRRISDAASVHLITDEMAAWAHDIRIDANDQRHADENAEMATEADARKVIEFASALAQFLYVLPARVARGRATEQPQADPNAHT